MENKNIVLLKHHPMNVKFTNSFYTNQVIDILNDYIVVDVTSRVVRDKEFMKLHPNFDKDLSPFKIGPVISSDGTKCNIFEVFWQFGKVYPCHDDNGKPNEKYFKWRNEYYKLTKIEKSTMRHACETLGCSHKDTKYFAYYDKDKKEYIPLNYIEARKKVYIPEYAKLVVNTDSYKWLKSLVDSGKKVALVDFDAFNYYYQFEMKKRYESYLNKCEKDGVKPSLTEDDFLSIKCIKDAINSRLVVGHSFTLKLLLQGDIEVKDGQVIDHIGVLDL